MSLLTWSRVAEGCLAVMAAFVSVRSPRHRTFTAWIWIALTYSIVDQHWIELVLSHLPRPFTGRARLFLHLSQLLYVAVRVGFVAVVFDLARVQPVLRPIPWFVGFVALVALVGGYGHSPGPGLYVALGMTFRSRHVYEVVSVVSTALILGTLLPQIRSIYEECRSTDDSALLGSVLAIDAGWIATLVFDLTPVRVPVHADPLTLLLSFAFALGFHLPVVVLHSLGASSPRFVERRVRADRRESIYEMARRLEASHYAVDKMLRTGKATPASFPSASKLAHHAGLSFQLIGLALEDRAAAGAVECVLAVAGSLGTVAGAGLLVRVDDEIRRTASVRGGSDDEEFPWLEVFNALHAETDPYVNAVSMPLFAQLRGLSWSEALRVVEFAKTIATTAALRDPRFRARTT